jgi:ATP-dependent DNA helicase UvrD/PcrA
VSETATYLSELNREQRHAVEHGIGVDDDPGPPLLVIAGAGSGKTKTLAHRVAHLIVKSADPRRILLLTPGARQLNLLVVSSVFLRKFWERALSP